MLPKQNQRNSSPSLKTTIYNASLLVGVFGAHAELLPDLGVPEFSSGCKPGMTRILCFAVSSVSRLGLPLASVTIGAGTRSPRLGVRRGVELSGFSETFVRGLRLLLSGLEAAADVGGCFLRVGLRVGLSGDPEMLEDLT